MKKVAIVIPTHKNKLGRDDLISLNHLQKHLGKYDKYFVIPRKIDTKKFRYPGIKFIRFPNVFFESWRGYNELLLTKEFYEKFKDYEYILIYQLDVLVLSDQLKEWISKGYDYIAPPWFRPVIGRLSHKKGSPPSGGNGGFSLRKISSALQVLDEVSKLRKRNTANAFMRKLRFMKAVVSRKGHDIWFDGPAIEYPFAEDGFWSLEAPKYLEGYKVADFKEALKFGFERFPRKSFKLNGNKLPFGVHAWKKYDEKFWKPYLNK